MADDPITAYLYPEDPTGYLASNKVPVERQTLSPPSQSDVMQPHEYHFIIPFASPYFRDSIKLFHVPTNRELKRGVDWYPAHQFLSASFETQNVRGGLYLSVMFTDLKLAGQVRIDTYQTLGGQWVLSTNKILEILSNRLIDPRTATYEQVSGKPSVFPPIDHPHPVDDLTGFAELVIATQDIAAAIRARTQDFLNNPPILMSEYYTKDEIEAKLAAIGGGGVSEADIAELIDSMTTSYTVATSSLVAA